MNQSAEDIDKKLKNLIYVPNQKLESTPIKGYDFNQGVDYCKIFEAYSTTGLQATNFGDAIKIIDKMISWRLSDEPLNQRDDEETSDPKYRKNVRTRIFLGYTSNMISSGIRETIRYLAEHKMIDCIVTSAGGI